ncbi:unnamed protein product [Toxocara canis]|uniref:MFS domain-containing protein n=1 Tax=Toxocara canis TaxID=6265 RepID=A0A183V5F1_TOXCA|nr:unnamed protein product [Toxocara canis]
MNGAQVAVTHAKSNLDALEQIDLVQPKHEKTFLGQAFLTVGGNTGSSVLSTAEQNLRETGDEHSDIVESNELPPDGGYGWVVVFAAFMSNFIVDGICNSFGAFITTYQQYFGQSKALVTLVGSLLIGCYQLIGPFAGGLVKNYGVRPVVISGSLLASASFAASIYSPNIYLFMISYGLFGGAGFGLIYLPAIVSVSFYFNRKRSIATGITVAGSGAGTFVLPPVCMYLLKTLGWKITVCALAAVALSCTALGALYKPLAPAGLKKDQNGKSPPKLATCKLFGSRSYYESEYLLRGEVRIAIVHQSNGFSSNGSMYYYVHITMFAFG